MADGGAKYRASETLGGAARLENTSIAVTTLSTPWNILETLLHCLAIRRTRGAATKTSGRHYSELAISNSKKLHDVCESATFKD